MLRLYAGRENIDKERFLYDRIRERGGDSLVLVPNQYTLVAEKQALKYLETDCLFNVEILSMNRLGLRVLHEKGTESVRMLDKYGRFMLLTRLIKDHADDFEIFGRSAGKLSFTSMLNDFISEFKQQNCSEKDLMGVLEGASEYPLLTAKLKELSGVIRSYEESIKGIYTDPEDYITMYVDAIGGSGLVRGKSIWIYGYDSITPKLTKAVLELAKAAENVSFIVNRNDFGLDEHLIDTLERRASEEGIEFTCDEIEELCEKDRYLLRKSETIERIERGLWRKDDETEDNSGFIPEDLTLVCAANPYYEAENAAAYIWHLVRDLGYRMREIQVIANDEGHVQPIVRRVFAEYGLPIFSDATRRITDSAGVGFIVNLLWFRIYNKAPQFIFAMLKTGLSEYTDDEIEELENYVRSYHIKNYKWDTDFKYGAESVGAEGFEKLNEMRGRISASIKRLSEIEKLGSVAEFVSAFKTYLREEWHLDEMVEEAAREAEAAGLQDEAQRLTQGFEKALEILDQMTEIMGGEPLDIAEFTEIYTAGLADVKVGVIPAAEDGLPLGTMIRTRPGDVKATVVIGANEGVLPLQPSTEGLFSVDEKDYFKQKGFALGGLDDIKMNEENAAMYRMMAGPSEKLYISYALTDTDGKDASPSPVIEALTELFPEIEKRGFIKKDIISEGFGMEMVNTPDDGLRHLMIRLKEETLEEPSERASLTRAMLKWYRENRERDLSTMLSVSGYDNDPAPLGRDLASALFSRESGELRLSPSAITAYFDCPFKYYVNYGLYPAEERDFTTDARSVGDAYHECLMAVAGRLLDDRSLLSDAAKGDDGLISRLVDEELGILAGRYRGGLFVSAGTEKYRLERIREICAKAAKAMAVQLSAETVKSAAFEEKIGGRFEPIRLRIGDDDVCVEGRIDRTDILDVNGEQRVRVIDYKTGGDTLDLKKMQQGYRMQLMIYLISASSGEYMPAGMFYFNIKDPITPMNDKKKGDYEKVTEQKPEDMFKLKGTYLDEEGVLAAMPEEVLASSKGKGIDRESYEELKNAVMKKIEEIGEGILKGRIGIHPLRDGKSDMACDRCGYKSICRKDGGYAKNSLRYLKDH